VKIAIVAPSPVPFVVGGAESCLWGLQSHINQFTPHQAELIKVPTKELDVWDLIESYERFSRLDLSYFDLVISSKYPAWMVNHPNHVCYMMHRLRGLYDTYHFCGEPETFHCDDPEINRLRAFMRRHWSDRRALAEWFEHAARLRARDALSADLLRFPGPFIREVVHYLDGVGLAPQSIRRFAAISGNVSRRENYFPSGVAVDVIYPPSNLKNFKKGRADYLFTVSRLDGPKRLGLLIDAMKHVRSNVELCIAGTGPLEQRLRDQAAQDARIRFLGFISDGATVDMYADALAVPFVPYDEDYGLVTIEAMRSGKPVLTATDSGGPLEFVRDGETGLIAPPEPEALAERIEYLCRHRVHSRLMGMNGERAVSGVTWDNVVSRLLDSPRARRSLARRPKVTVAINFPIFPPRGGGQCRTFHLYRHLARQWDIDVVSLAGGDNAPFLGEIAPGLREIRVPRSPKHQEAEEELARGVNWVPITDVVLPDLYRLTPGYLETLRKSAATADVVIAVHPYFWHAVESVTQGKPIWYEAQNVEADLKRSILPQTPTGLRLLESVRAVEQEACDQSSLIITCSADDGSRMSQLYGVDPRKIVVAPNGVDVEHVVYVTPTVRQAAKRALGMDGRFVALFTGSWHGPNLEAVGQIIDFARRLPHVNFLVLGGAGLAFRDQAMPSNLGLMGIVDDATLATALETADVALNPMASGSGTNLKMLEYFAAGIPVISTEFGARGLAVEHEVHLEVADFDAFPRAIESLRQNWPGLAPRIARAREHVLRHFNWQVIANKVLANLGARQLAEAA
jgi:glycosyltransferase involved in cell wall biosynthesis